MGMQRFVVLFAGLLMSISSHACSCTRDLYSPDALKSYLGQVDQVVRVKIMSRTSAEVASSLFMPDEIVAILSRMSAEVKSKLLGTEEIAVYQAQLLESIKPTSSAAAVIEVRSRSRGCGQPPLEIGEEWLIFMSKGYMHGECSPTHLLGDAGPNRRAIQPSNLYESFYTRGAQVLADVRRLVRESAQPSPQR